jgi:hypothetical protein
MKHLPVILLLTFSVVAQAQQTPDDVQDIGYAGYAGPYGAKHVQKKRLERIAIGRRVQQNLRIASIRKEVQYDKNRRQCQAALQVAELCGKFAGTFYCNEKGFQPIAPDLAIKAPVMDNVGRYRMERCALDVVRSGSRSAE